jgi:hypothetical protein
LQTYKREFFNFLLEIKNLEMSNTIYINQLSGTKRRHIYDDDEDPSAVPGFDTWLDFKCLNLYKDYPWVSFQSSEDFAEPPRPHNIKCDSKNISGYFIIFKESAISRFSDYFKHYMKIRPKYAVNKTPNGIEIFFPKSAYQQTGLNKIYIDGPRPNCINFNPFAVIGYDTWINMNSLGENYPWVVFNKDMDINSLCHQYSDLAINFKPNAISDSNIGMMNPMEIPANSNNVSKNSDGTITIIIPNKDYVYVGLPTEIEF